LIMSVGDGANGGEGFHLAYPNVTAGILAKLERRYSISATPGSRLEGVPCAKKGGFCTGGDRMGKQRGGHSYGECYATAIRTAAPSWRAGGDPAVIAEVGILAGSGLAVWDRVFAPTARVYGFDFFLNNTREALPHMKRRDAFLAREPVLTVVNQLGSVHGIRESARVAFGGSKAHLIIDDGEHSPEAIASTFLALAGFLRHDGMYVIEDIPRKWTPKFGGDPERSLRQAVSKAARTPDFVDQFIFLSCAHDPRFILAVTHLHFKGRRPGFKLLSRAE